MKIEKQTKKLLINYDKQTDIRSVSVPVSKLGKDLVIKDDFDSKELFLRNNIRIMKSERFRDYHEKCFLTKDFIIEKKLFCKFI